MFQETSALKKIKQLKKRIRVIQGGTSASKTISILLYLIAYAQTDKTPTLTSVVAESIPHLKRGVIRDFKKIMQSHKYWNENLWNETDKIYSFETGSQIEFFSTDNGEKLRGSRRDRLFCNEANNIEKEAFEQLEIRTKEFVFIDYNPTSEFWAHFDLIGKRDDVDFLVLTYIDNEGLDKNIVEAIERRKINPRWWRVYGEGQIGEVEGRIYTGWTIIDEIPVEARLERRGLDYGYTNDPTAIVDVYKWNGAFIFDQVTYQRGLSNRQIADILKNQENTSILVVADSAEPKSNDELISYGVNLLSANKGQGSVNHGIQVIQDQRILITKRSVDLIKEYRGYMWEVDRNGRILNTPEGGDDHALDAVRYAMETLNLDTGLSDVDKYMMMRNRNMRGINHYE